MDIGWAPRFFNHINKNKFYPEKEDKWLRCPYLWTSLKELTLLFSILDQRAVWNRSAVWCGASLSSTGGTLFLPNLIIMPPSIDPHNVSNLCLKLLLFLRHGRSFLYTFHTFHILWLQHSLPSKNIHYLGLHPRFLLNVRITRNGQKPNLLWQSLNRRNELNVALGCSIIQCPTQWGNG